LRELKLHNVDYAIGLIPRFEQVWININSILILILNFLTTMSFYVEVGIF